MGSLLLRDNWEIARFVCFFPVIESVVIRGGSEMLVG